jgi:hypothetical protein
MGERRGTYRVSVGTSEGSRLLGRRRHRWEHNIRMEIGLEVWTGFIWLRIGTSGELL